MASENDVIKVTATMSYIGQTIQNVYHFGLGADQDDGFVIADLADLLEGAYTNLLPNLVDLLDFQSISFYNLTEDQNLGEYAWPSLTDGTATGEGLPTGVAGLVTFPTLAPKTRGRKFIAGISETFQADGVLVGTVLTNLLAFGADLLGVQVGGFGTTGLWGVVNALGTFFALQEALSTNVPAYQRRRKQGVGT